MAFTLAQKAKTKLKELLSKRQDVTSIITKLTDKGFALQVQLNTGTVSQTLPTSCMGVQIIYYVRQQSY